MRVYIGCPRLPLSHAQSYSDNLRSLDNSSQSQHCRIASLTAMIQFPHSDDYAITLAVFSTFCFCFALLAFRLLRDRRRHKLHVPLPPGPAGWPLVGNTLDWPDIHDQVEVFGQWAEKYGEPLYSPQNVFSTQTRPAQDRSYMSMSWASRSSYSTRRWRRRTCSPSARVTIQIVHVSSPSTARLRYMN